MPVPDPARPEAARPEAARPEAALPLAKQIVGYCDPLSAAPGDDVRFFVSCEPGITSYQADLVRLRAGPPGWEDDGPEAVPVPSDFAGQYPARQQPVHPGSYALIPGAGRLLDGGQRTVAVLVQPTHRPAASQVLLSCGDPCAGTGFALLLDGDLRPALVTAAGRGQPLACGSGLAESAWSAVVATFGGGQPAVLSAGPLAADPRSWTVITGAAGETDKVGVTGGADSAGEADVTSVTSKSCVTDRADMTGGADRVGSAGAPGEAGKASVTSVTSGFGVTGGSLAGLDIVLGAAATAATGVTRLHFTGRMEAPMIMTGAVDPAEAARPLAGTAGTDSAAGTAGTDSAVGDPGAAGVLAAWDFSVGIGSWQITDVGPHGLHGTLHNLPMRAVRGARWNGATDWRAAPWEYGALHFLADALEDCRWSSDFSYRVPPGTRSGFYAARIRSGPHRDFIPFFVRPSARSTAKILLVAPSATYASYGNSRFWWENPIQEMVQDRLVEIGAEEQYLIAHPEVGASSYDCHLDGTDICYVSRRRPNLNMRPGHVRREGYTCDLYLVAWLDRLGIEYDVVTDEDLHLAGRGLLDRYRVMLTGTHPEYVSARMLDAISDWTVGGGRLMYLGGNGFSMNVSFDAERPWILENRRVELWERGADTQLAEARNSTDGLRGGYFPASGREPARLTGVETATMGFDRSYPYVLGPAARRPEAAFIFEGVSGGVIGDFGALGGGVVGQEWDNAAGHEFGPGHLVLASSRDHTLVPPMFGAVRPDYHADLVFYRRGAGAVFSVSSMAWCGALSHRDYDNEIARINGNVLRRFLDPAPFTAAREVAEQ